MWPDSTLTPRYLRSAPANPPPLPQLDSIAAVEALTELQARSLTGSQIDALAKRGLMDALGNRWLMREQECDYDPPSRGWTPESWGRQNGAPDNTPKNGQLDVAILMVDNRPPLPYYIPGTPFASPDSWGLPRTPLSSDYLPPRWGAMPADRANSEAEAAMAVDVEEVNNSSGSSKDNPDEDASDQDLAEADGTAIGDEDDDSATRAKAEDEDFISSTAKRSSRVSSFQLALTINHIFAQLHGHAFYLESPCVNETIGVNEALWDQSVSAALKRTRRGRYTSKHQKYLNNSRTCAGLSSAHKLGPFPPRPAAWAKLAALRYVARRHAFVLYLDSDAFVTRIWQPVEPLIALLGLRTGAKWLAVAGEYPPQKLRRDTRAGLANSGVLLLAGLSTAGVGVLQLLEEWIWPSRGVPLSTFTWPYDQNSLTQSVILSAAFSRRVTLLKPGCPLNSPFGAYIRHYVGGTPDRSVYHHHHRAAWLLEALRCTVGLVAEAATPTANAGGSRRSATPLSSLALRRAQGCAPNEPQLLLPLNASCGTSSNFSASFSVIVRGQRPLGGNILARVTASWWRACCALCAMHVPCIAWSFREEWPADTRNCVLLDRFLAGRRASATTLLGRIPGRSPPQTDSWPIQAELTHDNEALITYAVPAVTPWDN